MIPMLGKLCDRISNSCQKRRDTEATYAAERLRLAVMDYNEAIDLCKAAGLSVDVEAINPYDKNDWIWDKKLKVHSVKKFKRQEF